MQQVARPRWFVMGWAIAVLFHLMGNFNHLLVGGPIAMGQLMMLATSVWVLASPRLGPLVLLAGAQAFVLVQKLPVVGNHEIILMLTGMTVALGIVTGGEDWFRRAGPALRLMVLIAYGWIGVSKLNHDFLDPSVSCAVVFGDEMGAWVGHTVSDHGWLARAVIAATVAVELAIPVLLAWPVTRTRAVMLALAFHFFLALEPVSHVWDFSATLTPLFLLFAPHGFVERMEGAVQRAVDRWSPAGIATLGGGTMVVFFLSLFAGVAWWAVGYILWLVYGLTILITYGRWLLARPHPGDTSAVTFGSARGVVLIAVVLAMMNGLSPYLELRSAGAFNMYSNLQAVGGESNHLIIRRTLSLWRYETFAVETSDEDDPLFYYEESGLTIPDRNLVRFREQDEESTALIVTPGGSRPVDEVDLSPVNPFVAKVAALRAVDPTGPVQCLRSWGPAN